MSQKNKKILSNSKTNHKTENDSEAWQMSPKLEKILERIEYDIAHGKNISGPFNTAEEMIKSLKL